MVGKWAQQRRVDEAEDGGVGADAERERHDRRDREARRASQQTDGVADVASERLERREAATIAHRLGRLIDAAEVAAGRRPRRLRRQAAPDVLIGQQVEVILQFLAEVALDAVATERPRASARAARASRS